MIGLPNKPDAIKIVTDSITISTIGSLKRKRNTSVPNQIGVLISVGDEEDVLYVIKPQLGITI